MKILSLTNSVLDPATGSGKTVWAYTEGLKARGHEVEVLEPADYEPLMKLGKARKFRQALGAWWKVREVVKGGKYDVIEFYGDEFWLAIKHLSKLKSRPMLVAHTNGLELLRHERDRALLTGREGLAKRLHGWFSRQTHERLSRLAFSETDAFAALCESDCRHVIKLGLHAVERTAVVPPGLDEEYLDLPFDEAGKGKRVSFTGSWIERKGRDMVVGVMTGVLRKIPEATFEVFGAARSAEAVVAAFPEELRGRVVVHARLSNGEMAERLLRCRVFFFPTQYEGFGIAPAEAMACGNAVVTTPTGFGADLVHNGDAIVCGFDDAAAMQEGVESLLLDDERWRKLALAGWERSQRFRWGNALEVMESKYEQWLGEYRALERSGR